MGLLDEIIAPNESIGRIVPNEQASVCGPVAAGRSGRQDFDQRPLAT